MSILALPQDPEVTMNAEAVFDAMTAKPITVEFKAVFKRVTEKDRENIINQVIAAIDEQESDEPVEKKKRTKKSPAVLSDKALVNKYFIRWEDMPSPANPDEFVPFSKEAISEVKNNKELFPYLQAIIKAFMQSLNAAESLRVKN